MTYPTMGKVLGCTVAALLLATSVTAQEPSTSTTPAYAPEDITTALPTSLRVPGPYFVDLQDGEAMVADSPSTGAWLDLLRSVDKEPSDVHIASGIGYYRPDPDAADAGAPVVLMTATRLEGVAATDIMPVVLSGIPTVEQQWVDIGGRRVSMHSIDVDQDLNLDQDLSVYLYPKGEVLYAIMVMPEILFESGASVPAPEGLFPTIEDVLSSLP